MAQQPQAGQAGQPQDGGLALALIQHHRIRRTTDIPLFYGRKEKDTITPQHNSWFIIMRKLHV
jgi:hypothetical protein